MDTVELERALSRFGGAPAERRAVARNAADIAASGRYAADVGAELDVETVVDELADAREGGPASRWNWWLGSLEVAYGRYEAFQVRGWVDD